MRTTRIVCLAIAATTGGSAALAEDSPVPSPEIREDIERLMEVTKAYDPALIEQIGEALTAQIAQTIGAESPQAAARCVEIGMEAVGEMISDGGFQGELNALYARYFSHEDVLRLIEFYETPVGRKSIEVMPQLMSESMQVTMNWMARMNPVIEERVTTQLREEGLIE